MVTPAYWQSSVEAVEKSLSSVRQGKIIKSTESAGGRPVRLLMYGKKNDLHRTANLSCALGASDRKCYADKTQPDYKPTLLLVGCIHGGEFEGTVALLNLISILETGVDLRGDTNHTLSRLTENINLLIIPCMNPDGRSRIEFDSMVGKTFEELRYYNQGTWKDGALCGWPECKKIHPIKDYCDFLGAYFNDDGINLMHDDFFGKMAPETRFLFDVVDEYVPDLTILLHGGSNTSSSILKPSYSPDAVKQKVLALEEAMKARHEQAGIRYYITSMDRGENKATPCSFNLTSALYHYSGEPCVTFESNQGLIECKGQPYTYEEIYNSHIMLFEEAVKLITNIEEGENTI